MARFIDTRAGQLRQTVEFQRREVIEDGYGNERGNWVPVFSCRAGFNSLRGSEAVIAARLTGVQPLKVRVRSSEETRSIQPEWRMLDANTTKTYAITAVMTDYNDRKWIDILVTEGVAK